MAPAFSGDDGLGIPTPRRRDATCKDLAEQASQRVDIAQRADQAAGALVGLALWRPEPVARGLALLRRLLARQPRGVGYAIQGLRHRCRTALVREPQHRDFEHVLAARHAQGIAHPHRTRRLGPLAADLDLAGLHRLARETAG